MSGKHASVPNVIAGLKFTGKAVKNLALSGCVYVRMTCDIFTTVISSDSSAQNIIARCQEREECFRKLRE